MKRFFILLCSLTLWANTFAANRDTTRMKKVDENLLTSFREQFPDAEQVVWETQPETFAVSFSEHGIRSRIVYDKQDVFVSSTRYYEERNLPRRQLNILKKRYAGKTIFAITELTTESGTEYHIKLQDDKAWLMVTMDSDGNIQNADEYRKAS